MIRKKLKDYIKDNIFPIYNLNENSHDINHIRYVIDRSLKFASQLENINDEMVYTIAAYHDCGHHIDAKNHEKVSAQILYNDNNLRKYFTENEIQTMKEAVEDHRASSNHEPRSIYGKIISSADRNTNVISAIKRTYTYNSKHHPELNQYELIEICRKYLLEKFGPNGYSKMFFKDEEYDKYIEEITKLVIDKTKFSETCKKINNLK